MSVASASASVSSSSSTAAVSSARIGSVAARNALSRVRAKQFCFTFNCPLLLSTPSRQELVDKAETFLMAKFTAGELEAYVFQPELATTGTFHLQGYVCFKRQQDFRPAKAFFVAGFADDTIHLEVSKGDRAQNYAYCTKPDSRWGDKYYEAGTIHMFDCRRSSYSVRVYNSRYHPFNHSIYGSLVLDDVYPH